MDIIIYIIVGVIAFVIYAIYGGIKREKAYLKIIADLDTELRKNPEKLFLNLIDIDIKRASKGEIGFLLGEMIINLAIERKVRPIFNENNKYSRLNACKVVPLDMQSTPSVKKAFYELTETACFILNKK